MWTKVSPRKVNRSSNHYNFSLAKDPRSSVAWQRSPKEEGRTWVHFSDLTSWETSLFPKKKKKKNSQDPKREITKRVPLGLRFHEMIPRDSRQIALSSLITETLCAGFARNSKTGHRGDDAGVFKDRNGVAFPTEEARGDQGGHRRRREGEGSGVTKRGISPNLGGPPAIL